ncbi:MAG: biotin--[acetyl-CoA-carboxylase] ligase [Bacteroidota bacterium]
MQTSLKVIKLDAIDSTNDYLKALSKKAALNEDIVVVARDQTRGRGQRNAQWYSEVGKSLSFSIFKKLSGVQVANQFAISFAVSVGVLTALKQLDIPQLAIKWPNDILAGSKKIAGILIENQLSGNHLVSAVIGVGLNVNNEDFPELPQASSLRLQLGRTFNLDEVLSSVVTGISSELNALSTLHLDELQERYERDLFRINKISVFETPQQERWNGIIRGVSQQGKLLLEREDGEIHQFQLKEIKLCY